MKNIFKLLLVSLIFTACEDADTVVYNGSQENPTFLSFSSSTIGFPIARTVGSDLIITLNSSTVSSVDRVYNLVVNEEISTADEALYDMPSQIVIPAGSYSGTAVVHGFDNDIDSNPKTVVFTISNLQPNESMDHLQTTLSLYEVCPLAGDAPFTGEYTVEQITPGFPNIGDAEIFGDDNGTLPIVTLEMGASDYERSITADVYPEATSGLEVTFNFRITCDGINLTSTVDTGVACNPPSSPGTLQFAAGNNPGTVDHDDDTSFFIILTENPASGCNGTPRQTILQLTKVN